MGISIVRKGVQIVAPTLISSPTMIINKEIIPTGFKRYICVSGKNAELFVYTKANDLAQTATYLVGALGSGGDWNDDTYLSATVAVSTAETDWVVIDLGTLGSYYVHYKIGQVTAGYMKVYISQDNVTWTLIKTIYAGTTYEDFKKYYFRYIKFTYGNASTTNTAESRIYSCEIFNPASTSATEYAAVDAVSGTLDYVIQTTNEKVIVVLENNGNNVSYSITDLDPTNVIIVET